jgi:hypothetical protein
MLYWEHLLHSSTAVLTAAKYMNTCRGAQYVNRSSRQAIREPNSTTSCNSNTLHLLRIPTDDASSWGASVTLLRYRQQSRFLWSY